MAGSDDSKDQERLAKLWDAYELQEKELELSLKKIATFEHKIEELNRVNDVLKKSLEDRDREIRELDIKVVALEEQNSKFEPKINDLTQMYDEEKKRYTKLFTITEELEEELAKAKKENEIQEQWFSRNVGMLENLRQSVVDRNIKLKEVVETPILSITEEKPPIAEADAKPVTEEHKFETPPPAAAIDSEEDKSITFKKVEVEKEPEVEAAPPVAKPVDESTKNETIYEFSKIPNVDPIIAENLYNAGYMSLDELKVAKTEDLATIDGISPTLARKIRTSLFEMSD
jgi:DNA integrity scanning protein DisA with diadenylate cyclase activity